MKINIKIRKSDILAANFINRFTEKSTYFSVILYSVAIFMFFYYFGATERFSGRIHILVAISCASGLLAAIVANAVNVLFASAMSFRNVEILDDQFYEVEDEGLYIKTAIRPSSLEAAKTDKVSSSQL